MVVSYHFVGQDTKCSCFTMDYRVFEMFVFSLNTKAVIRLYIYIWTHMIQIIFSSLRENSKG